SPLPPLSPLSAARCSLTTYWPSSSPGRFFWWPPSGPSPSPDGGSAPHDLAPTLPGSRRHPVRTWTDRVPVAAEPDRHVLVGRDDATGRGAQLRCLQPLPRQSARPGVHPVRHRRRRVRGRDRPGPVPPALSPEAVTGREPLARPARAGHGTHRGHRAPAVRPEGG